MLNHWNTQFSAPRFLAIRWPITEDSYTTDIPTSRDLWGCSSASGAPLGTFCSLPLPSDLHHKGSRLSPPQSSSSSMPLCCIRYSFHGHFHLCPSPHSPCPTPASLPSPLLSSSACILEWTLYLMIYYLPAICWQMNPLEKITPLPSGTPQSHGGFITLCRDTIALPQ